VWSATRFSAAFREVKGERTTAPDDGTPAQPARERKALLKDSALQTLRDRLAGVLLALLFLLPAAAAPSTHAATVAHWRFEPSPGFLDDSGPHDLALSPHGTPQPATLPDDGAASSFPTTLPSGNGANEQAAVFSGQDWFETVGPPGLAGADGFTVEVLFNPGRSYRTAHGTTGMLVSQYATAGGRGGWYLGTRDNQLRFGMSQPNGSVIEVSSAFAGSGIAPNADYYAAAVFRPGRVTFHLQNLTAGEPLDMVEGPGFPDRLPDPDAPLKIGSFDTDPPALRWQGWIDEVRLSDVALEPDALLAPPPGWPHRPIVDGLYLPASTYEAPAILVPRDKRVPFGWPSFPLSPAGQAGSARLTWPAQDLPPGDDLRLRLALALDVQEANRIEVRLVADESLLGTLEFVRSTLFQIGEIKLTRVQAAQVLESGVELIRTEGVNPLRFLAPTPSPKATPAVLQPHLLVAGEDIDPWAEFFQRLRGLDVIQHFGWMEGGVLEGIYDLAQAFPTDRYATSLDRHLDQFLIGPNLIVEHPNGTIYDNTVYGIEGTLPYAVIARRRPEHPSVQWALNYWESRVRTEFPVGIVADAAGSATAEGNYTVAYPMLAIARQRGDLALETLAIEQYRIRQSLLVDAQGDIWLRYNRGTNSFRNWARGVTWYFVGLMRGLVETRDRDDLADLRAEALRVMDHVLRYQQPDGLWRNFLDDPEQKVDTSGSAGIAAALALGAAYGLLPERARDAALHALDGLGAHLTPDGLLGGATPSNRGTEALGDRRVIFPLAMGFAAQLIAAKEQPTFALWRRQHFTNEEQADDNVSGPLATPANDGVSNLLKYALGRAPRVPLALASVLRIEVDSLGRLSLQFERLRRLRDLDFSFEVSGDLRTWRVDPDAVRLETAAVISDLFERVRAVAVAADSEPTQFVRMRVGYRGRLYAED
jgi:hypothetical protein